jgi:hypothetical protein
MLSHCEPRDPASASKGQASAKEFKHPNPNQPPLPRAVKVSISDLIVDQLALGEMRILFLVVALRKTLGQSAYIKGDLSSVVGVALRKLVASKVVIEHEGTYSLNR